MASTSCWENWQPASMYAVGFLLKHNKEKDHKKNGILWTSLGKRKYDRNCLRSLFRNFIQVHWQIDNTDMQDKRKRHDYQKS